MEITQLLLLLLLSVAWLVIHGASAAQVADITVDTPIQFDAVNAFEMTSVVITAPSVNVTAWGSGAQLIFQSVAVGRGVTLRIEAREGARLNMLNVTMAQGSAATIHLVRANLTAFDTVGNDDPQEQFDRVLIQSCVFRNTVIVARDLRLGKSPVPVFSLKSVQLHNSHVLIDGARRGMCASATRAHISITSVLAFETNSSVDIRNTECFVDTVANNGALLEAMYSVGLLIRASRLQILDFPSGAVVASVASFAATTDRFKSVESILVDRREIALQDVEFSTWIDLAHAAKITLHDCGLGSGHTQLHLSMVAPQILLSAFDSANVSDTASACLVRATLRVSLQDCFFGSTRVDVVINGSGIPTTAASVVPLVIDRGSFRQLSAMALDVYCNSASRFSNAFMFRHFTVERLRVTIDRAHLLAPNDSPSILVDSVNATPWWLTSRRCFRAEQLGQIVLRNLVMEGSEAHTQDGTAVRVTSSPFVHVILEGADIATKKAPAIDVVSHQDANFTHPFAPYGVFPTYVTINDTNTSLRATTKIENAVVLGPVELRLHHVRTVGRLGIRHCVFGFDQSASTKPAINVSIASAGQYPAQATYALSRLVVFSDTRSEVTISSGGVVFANFNNDSSTFECVGASCNPLRASALSDLSPAAADALNSGITAVPPLVWASGRPVYCPQEPQFYSPAQQLPPTHSSTGSISVSPTAASVTRSLGDTPTQRLPQRSTDTATEPKARGRDDSATTTTAAGATTATQTTTSSREAAGREREALVASATASFDFGNAQQLSSVAQLPAGAAPAAATVVVAGFSGAAVAAAAAVSPASVTKPSMAGRALRIGSATCGDAAGAADVVDEWPSQLNFVAVFRVDAGAVQRSPDDDPTTTQRATGAALSTTAFLLLVSGGAVLWTGHRHPGGDGAENAGRTPMTASEGVTAALVTVAAGYFAPSVVETVVYLLVVPDASVVGRVAAAAGAASVGVCFGLLALPLALAPGGVPAVLRPVRRLVAAHVNPVHARPLARGAVLVDVGVASVLGAASGAQQAGAFDDVAVCRGLTLLVAAAVTALLAHVALVRPYSVWAAEQRVVAVSTGLTWALVCTVATATFAGPTGRLQALAVVSWLALIVGLVSIAGPAVLAVLHCTGSAARADGRGQLDGAVAAASDQGTEPLLVLAPGAAAGMKAVSCDGKLSEGSRPRSTDERALVNPLRQV